MHLHLLPPPTGRLSPWFAVAQDRAAWWALHHGLTTDASLVNSLRAGRLVGRLWPDAEPNGLYLATDLAVWAGLVRTAVADPAFPIELLPAWSDRLVAAFAGGEGAGDDAFASALVNVRRRWPLSADEARVPACTAALSRFLSAVDTEARWLGPRASVAVGEAVDVRAVTTGLPLLLTCVPAEGLSGLGGRECASSRALVRRAGAVVAWARDLAGADEELPSDPPSLLAWLEIQERVGTAEAISRASVRFGAESIGFATAADEARRSDDPDARWLAGVLSDFVAGFGEWYFEGARPPAANYEPTPFPAPIESLDQAS